MKFLRYVTVCTLSFWVGLVLALAFSDLLWSALLVCSVISAAHLLLRVLARILRPRRSPLKPRAYYGPARTQPSQPQLQSSLQLRIITTSSLVGLVDRAILDLTNEAVVKGQCQCCEKAHFMLNSYPFDPQFHHPNCVVPDLRAMIVPVSIYQSKAHKES